MSWESNVIPHGPFQKLHSRLWQVTGNLPYGPIPRNMVVYLLDNGELLLHSVIALEEPAMVELEKLGKPTYMIIPNRFHRLDAKAYKDRYPHIKAICPAATLKYAEDVVEIYGNCEDVLPKLGIETFKPEGTNPYELMYKFPLDSGYALVMTDMMFNLKNQKGLQGLLLRLVGSSGFFGTTSIGKMLIINNRKQFKNWMHQFASKLNDLNIISVAHGDAIVDNCRARLLEAIQRL